MVEVHLPGPEGTTSFPRSDGSLCVICEGSTFLSPLVVVKSVFLIPSCTGACIGSMLVVVIVWLIKTRRLSPSTSLPSSWFLLMPASLGCLLLASSCLGVRINCASFAPVFKSGLSHFVDFSKDSSRPCRCRASR